MGVTTYAHVVRRWKMVGGRDLAEKLDNFVEAFRDCCTIYYSDGGCVLYELYGLVSELKSALEKRGLEELVALLEGIDENEEVSLLVNVI